MNALFYLFLHRYWNSIRRAIRQPRLLIPGVVIALVVAVQAWALLLLVTGNGFPHTGGASVFTRTDLQIGGPAAFLLALRGVFLLSLFSAMNTALGEGGLFFTQSDVDCLFPAPLGRRGVLFARMLSRYLGLLIPAIYVPLTVGGAALAGSARISPLAFWPGFLGAWLYLAAVTNIAQAVSLGKTNDRDDDTPGGQRRRLLKRAITTLMIMLACGAIYLTLRYLSGEGKVEVGLFARAIHSDVWNRSLLPDAWAADLFGVAFIGWSPGDGMRMIGLILFAAASFVWLYGMDRDFYEAATEVSAKRTRLQNAMRSGNVGDIVSDMAREGILNRGRSIREFGGGAWAILWKDCVGVTRAPVRSWFQLMFLAALPALAGAVFGRHGDISLIFWNSLFALQMAGFFLLSLRDMLRRADLSKCLPIAPWKFIAAELGLSVAQLTLLGWFSLGVMVAVGIGRGAMVWVGAWTLPTQATLLLLVQTVVLLLYPNAGDPAQGFLSGILSLIASMIALLPGAIVGIVLYLLKVPYPLLGIAIGMTNLSAAALTLILASWLWRRFDPTD